VKLGSMLKHACTHMKQFDGIRRGYKYLATLATAAALLAAAPARDASAETLILGTVGKDVKAEMKEHEGLAAYLQQQLASAGVDKVDITVLSTAAKMTDALKTGAVQLYFESPLVAAKVGRDSGAVPLVRRWRKGVAEYWSEIVVLNDAPIQSLNDLRGRVIAFDDPDSTSGHLLPRAMLREQGLGVEILKRPTDPLDPTKVGGVFTLSDKASIMMLFDGRVAAIATDPQYMARIESERPGAVRSIGRSVTVPRHVVMRAAAMPEPKAQRVAEVFMAMGQSEEGRKVLSTFGKTDRFDAFPQGIEATFAPLYTQLRLLEAENAPVTGTQ
jgi:phosphonate transport system substrate-binding protein